MGDLANTRKSVRTENSFEGPGHRDRKKKNIFITVTTRKRTRENLNCCVEEEGALC